METRTDHIVNAYQSQQSEHQWFIEEENSCPLCGSGLELDHEVNPLNLKVTETAHCPSCKITTKAKTSSLQ